MVWHFPNPFQRSGRSAADQRIARPEAAETPQDPRAASPEAATTFIARQPIFNPDEKVQAYQLLVRSDGLQPAQVPASAEDATQLMIDTLYTFGVATALGERSGFITLPEKSLLSDLIELLPRERFVLEYPAELIATPEGASRCTALAAQGWRLACVYHTPGMAFELRPIGEFAIYDLACCALQDIARIDTAVKRGTIRRVLRHVSRRADFEAARGFHFDLYQGSFFTEGETLASKRVDPTRHRVIEIFNMVANRADVGDIENAFKQDVALCYSLLCYINSVGIGMQYRVASIRNAIMLLGYDFLWRWLSLLIYAGIDLSAAQRVLLNTATVRGRLAELLGQSHLGEKDAHKLFVVGSFSLLDSLLGVSMEEALQRIRVPEDVEQALTRREGRFAPYLDLVLAFESDNQAQAQRLARELGIELSTASRAHLAALEWAGQLAR